MHEYDEAMIFVHRRPVFSALFQSEFNKLWQLSDEFGETKFPETIATDEGHAEKGLNVFFNSSNYNIKNGRMTTIEPKAWTLTKSIVNAIDQAKNTLDISTTRIVLRPIYDAILRAAQRGVKISVLVNQDQYSPWSIRKNKSLKECSDSFTEDCSSNIDFPWFLDSLNYAGKENVTVRVKFFSLNTKVTLAKQMHSKYVVVDSKKVMSGSFNWSVSSEYGHIENVVEIDGDQNQKAVDRFVDNHKYAVDQGRGQYKAYIAKIEEAIKTGVKTDCSFDPMALTYQEIDYLLDSGMRAGKKPFKAACK
jgi:phosphatidylserine/phosphatidylglycerophosphate/cardiolipin synthase-like enzyme